MPLTDESLVIVLPAAADVGQGNVTARTYPIDFFINRQNYFVASQIRSIRVTPSWARVNFTVIRGITVLGTFQGSDNADLNIDISDTEPTTVHMQNWSIDTGATISLVFRSWQHGDAGL